MRKSPWAICLWPGLPRLWLEGAWSGLLLALTAAGLLDVLLLSTLVWVEWFDARLVKLGWLAAVGLWIGAAMVALRARVSNAADDGTSGEGLFRGAQAEYLQGDYFQAEASLVKLLEANPRDAEARLLLATLYRHTLRHEEAEDQLQQLARFETAARWQIEITGERARLKHLRKKRKQATTEPNQTNNLPLPGTSQAA